MQREQQDLFWRMILIVTIQQGATILSIVFLPSKQKSRLVSSKPFNSNNGTYREAH
jgi:hypothetical protein